MNRNENKGNPELLFYHSAFCGPSLDEDRGKQYRVRSSTNSSHGGRESLSPGNSGPNISRRCFAVLGPSVVAFVLKLRSVSPVRHDRGKAELRTRKPTRPIWLSQCDGGVGVPVWESRPWIGGRRRLYKKSVVVG
ncbi:hypothetical protein Q8A73_015174 [Channa argus]|nr:hypothetical protein Q8A73_015174 [Channa argus]